MSCDPPTYCQLLELWQERLGIELERARLMAKDSPGRRMVIAEAAMLEQCIHELRQVDEWGWPRKRLEAAGLAPLAPLPGQVLDDQTIDALDRRHAELEARVDALERAVSQ
jgi:hypothetical protein